MVNMPKLYTKTGDKGKTSLYDGTRTYKEEYIFDVLGTMDELNCHIGFLAVLAPEVQKSMRLLQYRITQINSVIATPTATKPLPQIEEKDIALLESLIDTHDSKCPPLREFVLPVSNKLNAQSHICRVVARKAERMLNKLFHNPNRMYVAGQREIENGELPENKKLILKWMNRLSDLFFALSRLFTVGTNREVTMSEMKEFLN